MRKYNLLLASTLFVSSSLWAQHRITGSVRSAEDNGVLSNAVVYIEGQKDSVWADHNGTFIFPTEKSFPFWLTIRKEGYRQGRFRVNRENLGNVSLTFEGNRLTEVVVTASRKAEALSKIPVTVERLTATDLQNSPTPSFYDALASQKGVNTLNTSIAFTVYNTRGFQSPTNLRFVQLTDGADNVSPELGLPIANTIGAGELDIERVELIPGASSAIYGLNAANGLVNLITKDPFTYQGLSFSAKSGVNNVGSPTNGIDATPYNNLSLRYAHAFNDKFAFKINLGYLRANDWAASDTGYYFDYNPSGLYPHNRTDPGYDGANIYGDEQTSQISLNGVNTFVTRTGYAEKDLTDYKSRLLHGDATLVYRFSPKTEISYTYRGGLFDGLFTRGNKLKFKDFAVQQHLLQLKAGAFSLKSYVNTENSGKSYNVRYLADAIQNAFKSKTQWNTDFQTAYNAAIAGGSSASEASLAARAAADAGRPEPGTAAFNTLAETLKNDPSWTTGAKFLAKGFLSHTEALYDASKFTHKIVDVLIGANYRYNRAKSDGTFYPDTAGNKVYYYQYGGFVQLAKDITKQLRAVGSIRYDKARSIDGLYTTRLGLIYSPNEYNNLHLSFQNGYRLPSFYEGYQYLVTPAGVGVGGLKANIGPLDIIGNSYSYASVLSFAAAYQKAYIQGLTQGQTQAQAQATALQSSVGILEASPVNYLKPEQNKSIELGYKGSFADNRLYIDFTAYYSQYKNFIQTFTLVRPAHGISNAVQGATDILTNQIVGYQTASNISSKVNVYGGALRIDYRLYKGYVLSGNVNYNGIDWGNFNVSQLANGFNTPKYNTHLSFFNHNAWNNFGFNVQWNWTDKIDWYSEFSTGKVPTWNTLDALVTYKANSIKALFSIGATNLTNKYYRQYIGGPNIGGLYYASVTFDGLLSK